MAKKAAGVDTGRRRGWGIHADADEAAQLRQIWTQLQARAGYSWSFYAALHAAAKRALLTPAGRRRRA